MVINNNINKIISIIILLILILILYNKNKSDELIHNYKNREIINVIAKRKLKSGKTIEYELNKLFPSVKNRKWVIYKNNNQIIIEYVIDPGLNFCTLNIPFTIEYDKNGIIRNKIHTINDIFNKIEIKSLGRLIKPFNIMKNDSLDIKEKEVNIKLVAEKKLNSGSTIQKELDNSFDSIPQENRTWACYQVNEEINIVIYSIIYDSGKIDIAWLVNYSNNNKVNISSHTPIARFLEESDEANRRWKILDTFTKEEREIYLYICNNFNDEERSKSYKTNMVEKTSIIFNKKPKDIIYIYNKINKSLFKNI
ncbi:MAG TPA: hypothetical protein PK771_09130 [Spirochaetota bacterium]|nr:hypothetical protein [Spirochaetota bacterium]